MANENNNPNNMGQNPTNQQPNMGQQPMNNQQQYQGMPQNPNMQGNPNMNQGQYNQGQFNNQQAYQGQYQGMPQNPNMQGNPNMNQGQYNPNMNGQQPYQGQFQGQMPPNMNQGQYNQGQFNNQQAYQAQYQGMPQNPNMMNPQFQGYNQAKAPSKLGLKLKELGMKIKQNKKMAIISVSVVLAVIIILVGGYLYHTRYNRALANHEFYTTYYDKNGKEDKFYKDDEVILQFRKKDFRSKVTTDTGGFEGGYMKYKVDGNKLKYDEKTTKNDGKTYNFKRIISKSGKDIKLTSKDGSYMLLHKIK